MAVHAAKGRGSFSPIALIVATTIAVALLIFGAKASEPPLPIDLGSSSNFAVLAGSGITNTGATTLSGTAGSDIGSSPTGTFTGADDVFAEGTKYLEVNPIVTTAKASLLSAYEDAVGRLPSQAITADLGGSSLTEGVYNSGSSIGLTGTLTLDGQNNSDAVFIFQAGSTLTTASLSKVELINGAQASNVFWQVGSSATFGTSTAFVGHVLAFTSITATTGATFDGQLLAINGAVTLDTNTVVNDQATVTDDPTPEPTVEPTIEPTAEPTVEPTVQPTTEPTAQPTVQPTTEPTAEPTNEPTNEPTIEPTVDPTVEPTTEPTAEPTVEPTMEPTVEPTPEPTAEPTAEPTLEPTIEPTESPIPEKEVASPTPTEEELPQDSEQPEETDTGGQLPDTGTTGWLLPLGVGITLLAAGAYVFLVRRRRF